MVMQIISKKHSVGFKFSLKFFVCILEVLDSLKEYSPLQKNNQLTFAKNITYFSFKIRVGEEI